MCHDPLMSCLGSVLWSLLLSVRWYLFSVFISVSLLYLSYLSAVFSLLSIFLCLSPHLSLVSVSESESYVTTDSQSASPSWNKAPVWGLRPDFYYHRTVAGLLMWGALSDERTGLSFTIAASPSQRSHSLVRAPLDSRPYFTVSDSRLPISSPPTTCRVTVEVFDPASTRVCLCVLFPAPQIQCLRLE
jgi:hypothetical protein